MLNKKLQGYGFTIASTISFSIFFVFAKLVGKDVSAIALVFYVGAASLLFCLPTLARTGLNLDSWVNPSLLGHAACHLTATFLMWWGLETLTPATAVLIGRTEPLFTIAIACTVLGEKFRRRYMGSFALISIGVVIVNGAMGEVNEVGITLVFASSLMFAIAEILAMRASQSISPTIFVSVRNVIITTVSGAIAVLSDQLHWVGFPTLGIMALVALAGPVASRIFYVAAMRRIEISTITLINEVEPICVASVAFIVLGVVPTAKDCLGGFFILAGASLLALPWKK